MTAITSKQRAELRRSAHHLKPVVFVGGEGVSESVLASILEALNTRELLKVKLQESAPVDVRAAATEIARRLEEVHTVQTIGRTIVLYRPQPDEKPSRPARREG